MNETYNSLERSATAASIGWIYTTELCIICVFGSEEIELRKTAVPACPLQCLVMLFFCIGFFQP